MNKLIYNFMVHDAEEELLLEYLLKDRNFAASYYDNNFEWVEYSSFNEIQKEFGTHEYPYTMRVYFNKDIQLHKFREKRARLFPLTLCGNDGCSGYDDCMFSPESGLNKNKGKYTVEYLWRCISYDEFDYCHDPND